MSQIDPMTREDFLETWGPLAFHYWYYNRDVWRTSTFMGVYCAKNVLDLWNYQEIIFELRPRVVIEFGTYAGGTALYLHWLMDWLRFNAAGRFPPRVVTVDIDHTPLCDFIRNRELDDELLALNLSSTHPYTENLIEIERKRRPGPMLAILDSDHSEANVLAELEMLRRLTYRGDYVIVEDTNINGHPVLPEFGPGPWEALEEYERRHPGDYQHDTERECKFGMTFNPRGYLMRR